MQNLQKDSHLQSGRYKILSTLGQGGFGITYLALQTGLERKVAIKEFFMKDLCNRDEATSHVSVGSNGSIEMVDRFKAKFLKEARNIARLNHPNIIRILDVFEENGTAYYVMECAEGGSLAEKVKRCGALPEPEAVRYILQIADALAYIHEQKMNHLDIKPANIMLNEKDDAILIDFGLSKQYDAVTGSQTSTTPVGISEGYAPIEQYKKGGVQEFSPETDIYALGATLFKLITGNTPPQPMDILADGMLEKPSDLSETVWNTIRKAMQPNKNNRYQCVNDFTETLNPTKTQEAEFYQQVIQQPVSIEANSSNDYHETEETQIIAPIDNGNQTENSFDTEWEFELGLRTKAKRLERIQTFKVMLYTRLWVVIPAVFLIISPTICIYLNSCVVDDTVMLYYHFIEILLFINIICAIILELLLFFRFPSLLKKKINNWIKIHPKDERCPYLRQNSAEQLKNLEHNQHNVIQNAQYFRLKAFLIKDSFTPDLIKNIEIRLSNAIIPLESSLIFLEGTPFANATITYILVTYSIIAICECAIFCIWTRKSYINNKINDWKILHLNDPVCDYL